MSVTLEKRTFLNIPYLRAGSNKSSRFKGQKRLRDNNSDFEEDNGISFAAYIVYSCNDYNQDIMGTFDRLPLPQIDQETETQVRPYFFLVYNESTSLIIAA
jgi:hypothetical protein